MTSPSNTLTLRTRNVACHCGHTFDQHPCCGPDRDPYRSLRTSGRDTCRVYRPVNLLDVLEQLVQEIATVVDEQNQIESKLAATPRPWHNRNGEQDRWRARVDEHRANVADLRAHEINLLDDIITVAQYRKQQR